MSKGISLSRLTENAVNAFSISILFLFPVAIVSLSLVHGLANLVIAALALVYCFKRLPSNGPVGFSAEEKSFNYAIFFLVFAVFFTSFMSGAGAEIFSKMGKFVYLLFVIPGYLFFRRTGLFLPAFWYGLAAGAIISAAVALLGVLDIMSTRYYGRASGVTHPIIFGDLSLLMGAMSVAGATWFRERGRYLVILPVLAAAMGLLASFLSQSRGGWVSIPVIAVIFVWYFGAKVPKWKLAMGLALLLLGLVAVYSIPATGVEQKISVTVENVREYFATDISHPSHGSSIGSRFEMWRASWHIFLENPLLGVGWGNYQHQAQLLVDQGLRHPVAAQHTHPHNQFITSMVSGGILGLFATLVLFIVPIVIFVKVIRSDRSADVHRIALAGLVMIVGFGIFNLSESFLERSRTVGFFVFYMGIFIAGINAATKTRQDLNSYRETSLA